MARACRSSSRSAFGGSPREPPRRRGLWCAPRRRARAPSRMERRTMARTGRRVRRSRRHLVEKGARNDLRRSRQSLRADATTAAPAGAGSSSRRLARALAELRIRPAARHESRDRAACLRPRHHALRPREQLRASLRLRRGELRPAAATGSRARIATS